MLRFSAIVAILLLNLLFVNCGSKKTTTTSSGQLQDLKSRGGLSDAELDGYQVDYEDSTKTWCYISRYESVRPNTSGFSFYLARKGDEIWPQMTILSYNQDELKFNKYEIRIGTETFTFPLKKVYTRFDDRKFAEEWTFVEVKDYELKMLRAYADTTNHVFEKFFAENGGGYQKIGTSKIGQQNMAEALAVYDKLKMKKVIK